MKFKSFVLGGAAMAGLIGVGFSMPAMAYTHHPSTPQEQQQTEELNQRQLALAHGQSTAQSGATSSEAPAGTAPSTAQSGADTEDKSAAAQGSAEPASTLVALDILADPPKTLENASVEANNGQTVGAVQNVDLDSDGKPQTVDIALLGGQSRTVAIAAAQLGYDQSRNVVVAQMSPDQIQALPPAPQG